MDSNASPPVSAVDRMTSPHMPIGAKSMIQSVSIGSISAP